MGTNEKLAKSYWNKRENQKIFLENFAKTIGIKNPKDWSQVTTTQIRKHGGSSLLKKYNNSLNNTLQNLLTGKEWKEIKFRKRTQHFWQKEENQRNFLDDFAKENNILNPKDWGNISKEQIINNGGGRLISIYGSLRNALFAIYKEIEFKEEWFCSPRGFWNSKYNQKSFMDLLTKNLNIHEDKEWSRVSISQIKEQGGAHLLNIYKGSLYRALSSIYSDKEWKIEWFAKKPNLFWKNIENQRTFLENFAKRKEIKSPIQWSRVSASQIEEEGGYSLLRLSQKSPVLFFTLKRVFPEINWKIEWFKYLRSLSQSHWKLASNRRQFMDFVASKYSVNSPSDWRRVSLTLIKKQGGKNLLSIYNNSLFSVLQDVYPQTDWMRVRDSGVSEENFMKKALKEIFPETTILFSFSIPGSSSNSHIELDAWIPEFNLALEYQGTQHYKSINNKDFKWQAERDAQRRIECERRNISLVEVPYWWNRRKESLIASIVNKRPDLTPFCKC